jgi:hypothetical protein
MEQSASLASARATAFESDYLSRISAARAVEFDPTRRGAVPIVLFRRPTLRDVTRVVGAWLFGWGVPQRGLSGRSK